jgi:anti-sigma factor RsiW
MTCEEYGENLIDYHYDELEPAARREVATHLASCGRCALEYCRLQADLSGLWDPEEGSPRPAVHARLEARVAREFGAPWWHRLLRVGTFPIPAYQVVLALALFVLAWGIWRAPQTPAPAPPGPAALITEKAKLAPPVLTGYDASVVVSLDPHLW